MTARSDLSGQRFGRLAVEAYACTRAGRAVWLCRCACGASALVRGGDLRSGNTRSCGCFALDTQRAVGRSSAARGTTHGRSRTPQYKAWAGMLQRCSNKNARAYKYYGARGIKACPRWFRFENFLADMGERPPGKTLDRINNDGNYEPSNCRWATPKEQQANRRVSK